MFWSGRGGLPSHEGRGRGFNGTLSIEMQCLKSWALLVSATLLQETLRFVYVKTNYPCLRSLNKSPCLSWPLRRFTWTYKCITWQIGKRRADISGQPRIHMRTARLETEKSPEDSPQVHHCHIFLLRISTSTLLCPVWVNLFCAYNLYTEHDLCNVAMHTQARTTQTAQHVDEGSTRCVTSMAAVLRVSVTSLF
jgi:hypothetical protein